MNNRFLPVSFRFILSCFPTECIHRVHSCQHPQYIPVTHAVHPRKNYTTPATSRNDMHQFFNSIVTYSRTISFFIFKCCLGTSCIYEHLLRQTELLRGKTKPVFFFGSDDRRLNTNYPSQRRHEGFLHRQVSCLARTWHGIYRDTTKSCLLRL